MLSLAASTWDVQTRILDIDDDMPAAPVCREFVRGDFRDYQTVLDFGRASDILTVEIEQVNVEALKKLQSEGKKVYPEPEILEMIQDKFIQNQWLAKNGFPKVSFQDFSSSDEILAALSSGKLKFPFVQKSRRFGYDGRGVVVVRSSDDLKKLLDGASMAEDLVGIRKEISVIAARNSRGETAVYDPVEMVFDPQANLVDYLLHPADLDSAKSAEAQKLALAIIQKMKMTGILAVEMFLDSEHRLWINEMAPRPHNSGHQTIESCVTSQYEQHLRSVLNLPLGSTHIKIPALMMNLLGSPGFEGPVRYEGLEAALGIEGVKIHLYGKKQTKPYRKMGHVTILDASLENAKKKAEFIRKTLKVVA